jgi:hypothetical protein
MFGKISSIIGALFKNGTPAGTTVDSSMVGEGFSQGTSEERSPEALKPTGVPPLSSSSHIDWGDWLTREKPHPKSRLDRRKKKAWVKDNVALFMGYPNHASSYEIRHRYHQDGYHRVILGNSTFSVHERNLLAVDLESHGHCIEFIIGKSPLMKEYEKQQKDFRTAVKSHIAMGKFTDINTDIGRAAIKAVEAKFIQEKMEGLSEYNRNILIPLLRCGLKKKVGLEDHILKSIGLVTKDSATHKYRPITVLNNKQVSHLGLDSRKIWFGVIDGHRSSRSHFSRSNDPMTVLDAIGFRRVPRKWVPEFERLLRVYK